MSYFPLCMDLKESTVLLVGHGPQTDEKYEKLQPFGADIRRLNDLTENDLQPLPAFVVVGDMESADQVRISDFCRKHRIPVNVVDEPTLCTFFFPSLITRGDLTVSVSTGGKSPFAAAWLRRRMEQQIPDRTEEILEWAGALRQSLPIAERQRILRQAVARALSENRPLTSDELRELIR